MSAALAIGHAAHCLILEGRMAFDEQYLVADGPVNARTGDKVVKLEYKHEELLIKGSYT